jgi:hypothetical protein
MKGYPLFGAALIACFAAFQLPCVLAGYYGCRATDLFLTASALIAAASGLYAFRSHGIGSVHGRSLLLLALAVLMLFMGNVIMAFSVIFLGAGAPPVGSIFFWLLQYPFYVSGLYLIWRMVKAPAGRRRLAAALLMVAAISALGVLAFVTAAPKGMDGVSILAQASLFGDTIALDMLAVIMVYSLGGRLFRLWGLILLSVLVLGASHIVVSVDDPLHRAVGLNVMMVGFLLMAFGFLYNTEMFRSAARGVPARVASRRAERLLNPEPIV